MDNVLLCFKRLCIGNLNIIFRKKGNIKQLKLERFVNVFLKSNLPVLSCCLYNRQMSTSTFSCFLIKIGTIRNSVKIFVLPGTNVFKSRTYLS